VRRPNIVLLTVDALRADRLSGQGYHRQTTPELDRFADANVDYTRGYAVSTQTREAAPPIVTGRWPEAFTANGYRQLDDQLPSRLQEAGYRTGAFHSNPFLSRAYGYDDGFEAFFDDLYLASNRLVALAQKALEKYVFGRGEYYARAPEINKRALSWIDSLDGGPFFCWNHYMDVHGPYHPPSEQFIDRSLSAGEAESLFRRSWNAPGTLTDDQRTLIADAYDDELRCLDAEIGAFLDALEDRDLLSQSLVVVTADHGELLGEDGLFSHPRRLREELLHVPMIVSTPGGANATVPSPVSTLDIAPTLAKSAGLSRDAMAGASLLEDGVPETVDPDRRVFASVAVEGERDVRRFAVRTDESILRQERATETGEVVGETHVGPDAEREPLKAALETFVADRLRQLDGTTPRMDVGSEIKSRLESLGYR
jgi:arylsulfatase